MRIFSIGWPSPQGSGPFLVRMWRNTQLRSHYHSSALATAERGGRAKAFFRLTPKGLREVRETQTSLTRLWDGLPI